MASLTQFEQIAWVVYENLQEQIADPTTSELDQINLEQVLDAFLRNESFNTALSEATARIATEQEATSIGLRTQQAVDRAANPPEGYDNYDNLIRHPVGALERGDTSPLVDLVDEAELQTLRQELALDNLQTLQASDYSRSLSEFRVELTTLNPKFDAFFEHVDDANGWFSDDPLYDEIGPALNNNASPVLNQLIEIAGDEARMDALIAAAGTDAGKQSLQHVLEAATPATPETPAPSTPEPDTAPPAETVVAEAAAPAEPDATQADVAGLNEFGVRAFDDAVEAMDGNVYYHVVADPRYAAIWDRFTDLSGIQNPTLQSEVEEAQQFVSDNPDPELAAEAEAFYATYLESPDAYMSEAPDISDTAPETPAAPEVVSTTPDLSASFAEPAGLATPAAVNIDGAPTAEVATDVEATPASSDFVWDDDTLVATYDNLRTLNPESVAGASAVVQEAYARVQPVVELETEFAHYRANPMSYLSQGDMSSPEYRLPPSEEALIAAEDTAYEHLASLSTAEAEALSTEVASIVANDAEQGITPLPPEVEGGQRFLADAGISPDGMTRLPGDFEAPQIDPPVENLPLHETDPRIQPPMANLPAYEAEPQIEAPMVNLPLYEANPLLQNAATEETPETPQQNTYDVAEGDNLWNIVREEYGLTRTADIVNAIDHIAARNPNLEHPNGETYNLAVGENAHSIFAPDPETGYVQTLNMPTAEEIMQPAPSPLNLQERGPVAIQFNNESGATPRPEPRPDTPNPERVVTAGYDM